MIVENTPLTQTGYKDELLSFLRSPYDRMDENATIGFKFKRLFQTLGVDILLSLGFIGLVAIVEELDLIDANSHAVAEAFMNMPTIALLLFVVVFGPLFEELIFRFPLRYEANPVMGIWKLAINSGGPDKEHRRAEQRAWWDRNYRWIFYGLVIAFALIHITNFEITAWVVILSPILFGAQLTLGALAGFLRVRYGFWFAYLLHALHNGMVFGLALLSPLQEVVDIQTDDYDLVIEQHIMMDDMDHRVTMTYDSIVAQNAPLESVITQLLSARNDGSAAVSFSPELHPNPRIDVSLDPKADGVDVYQILLDALREEYDFELEETSRGTYTVKF